MKFSAFALSALCLACSACTLGPDYVRPAAPVPASFREAPAGKPAEPQDALPRGAWWKIYGDATLDALAAQVGPANQNVQAALAQYRQARAAIDAAGAGAWPTLATHASVQRARSMSSSGKSAIANADRFTLLDASWEPDLWGSVARSVEAGEASAQASAATEASVRLAAEAQLVSAYFQLRLNDEYAALQRSSVAAYARSAQIARNQQAAGMNSPADVASAQAQLEAARASLLDLGVARAQYEHAIAILIGKAPADFSLASVPFAANLPTIPAGLPSQLLERRPDVAAAERKVAAANARIGVAQAAWFPTLTLSASGGFSASQLVHWISLPERVWAVGAAVGASVLDGGARSAKLDEARAAHAASVAQYRQVVLGSLQEVEDELVALRIYDDELALQERAVAAAGEAERIALNQYRAGLANYTSVVVAQTAANTARRTAWQVRGRQYAASVGLVRALGGGWDGVAAESRRLDEAATGAR